MKLENREKGAPTPPLGRAATVSSFLVALSNLQSEGAPLYGSAKNRTRHNS
jgi:hypothetical protein